MQEVLILVDEANFAGTARGFNRRPDWDILRDYLADPNEGRQLVEMVAYVGMPPDTVEYQHQRDRKHRFLFWLQNNGYLTVVRDGNPTTNGSYKANVDTIMAIDGLELAITINPDIVVLVTGDGDFDYLAEKLRRRGIRVEVVAAANTLSGKLKAAANGVTDLAPILNRMDALDGSDAYDIGEIENL